MIPWRKKIFFLKTLVRRAIFLFWGVWPLKSPPGAPGGPGGGIFSLITILWHRSNMFSRKKWGSKIFPAEKSVWLCNSLLNLNQKCTIQVWSHPWLEELAQLNWEQEYIFSLAHTAIYKSTSRFVLHKIKIRTFSIQKLYNFQMFLRWKFLKTGHLIL